MLSLLSKLFSKPKPKVTVHRINRCLFPDSWSLEMVGEKINEAINNAFLRVDEGGLPYYVLFGKTSDDILIRIVMVRDSDEVITAYPDETMFT